MLCIKKSVFCSVIKSTQNTQNTQNTQIESILPIYIAQVLNSQCNKQ